MAETETLPTRTLNVEVISATGLKDTELIGKSDPYVELKVGKTKKKTTVAKDQPSTPAWNETFDLPIHETDTDLLITIRNDDTLGRDEEMGHVLIPLTLIHGGNRSPSTFPLELKDKPHGEIILSLYFEGEGHNPQYEEYGLAEQVEGLSVVDTPENVEGEYPEGNPEKKQHGGLKEKIAGFKEKIHRKKEKKQRGSGDEGGSSSESDKE